MYYSGSKLYPLDNVDDSGGLICVSAMCEALFRHYSFSSSESGRAQHSTDDTEKTKPMKYRLTLKELMANSQSM